MLSRQKLGGTAAVLALLATCLGSTITARAGGAPAVGTCVITGSATFTPNDQSLPQANVTIGVTASGTCEGAETTLGGTTSISFGGTMPLAACAVGEGNMVGLADFSAANPPNYSGPATFVGGPAAATLTIAGLFDASATLAWSDPGAISACASSSGTASTALTGTFTFVNA